MVTKKMLKQECQFSRTIPSNQLLDLVVQGWEGQKWVAPEYQDLELVFPE